MKWYLAALKKYADFSGRSRRSEYFWFSLINSLIVIGLTIIDLALGTYSYQSGWGLFSGIYFLAVLIPAIAVTVRRLHDSGKSGLWLLITFIPFVGGILVLIFMFTDSEPDRNRFGLNPKEDEEYEIFARS